MKKILKYKIIVLLSFFIASFIFLFGCNGITPTAPIINSFTADSASITEGEIITLSWTVTDATTVTITPTVGSVALSGSTSVTPSETTTYTLTATKGTESSTASVTIIVGQTLIIQLGATEGKDSYVNSIIPDFNYASSEYLSIGQSIFSVLGLRRDKIILDSYQLRTFLQFNLNGFPNDSVVVSAVLKLYQVTSIETSGLVMGVHQVIQEWEESSVTWNNKPDYLTTPESTVTVPIFMTGWLSWDITSLVQGWENGSIANYGIALQDNGMTMEFIYINCYSSDYTGNPTLHPKLEIIYYVP